MLPYLGSVRWMRPPLPLHRITETGESPHAVGVPRHGLGQRELVVGRRVSKGRVEPVTHPHQHAAEAVAARRCGPHLIQHAGRIELPLQHGPVHCGVDVSGAALVKEPDDPVATKVGGVAHGRTPVAVGANQRVLVQQIIPGQTGLGDEIGEASAGEWALKPRNVPHAMWNASHEPVRLVEVLTPAGTERWLEEIAGDDARTGDRPFGTGRRGGGRVECPHAYQPGDAGMLARQELRVGDLMAIDPMDNETVRMMKDQSSQKIARLQGLTGAELDALRGRRG